MFFSPLLIGYFRIKHNGTVHDKCIEDAKPITKGDISYYLWHITFGDRKKLFNSLEARLENNKCQPLYKKKKEQNLSPKVICESFLVYLFFFSFYLKRLILNIWQRVNSLRLKDQNSITYAHVPVFFALRALERSARRCNRCTGDMSTTLSIYVVRFSKYF